MLIANQKRKENIAEYVIYMWQVEDLIRGFKLDIDLINEHIISKFEQPDTVKLQIKNWYEELIAMMRIEGVIEKGHLQININTVSLLNDLHIRLIKSPQHTQYHEAYGKLLNELAQLKTQNNNDDTSDIEHCFTILYGVLTLRLQQKRVSDETLQSAQKAQKLLSLLAKTYHHEKDNPNQETQF